MNESPANVHVIDQEGTIVEVNPAWIEFARANGLPGDPAAVVGQPVWAYIHGIETCYLYKELLDRVRAAGPMRLEYRCDSPDLRRFMEMVLSFDPGSGRFSFSNRVLRTEARLYQPLLDPLQPRSAQCQLPMCGWCKKVQVGPTEWVEVEQAVSCLRLFDAIDLPAITHVICSECAANFR